MNLLVFHRQENDWQRKIESNFVLLDSFCGCGTTINAAEKLGRDWIGIDPAPRDNWPFRSSRTACKTPTAAV